MSIDMTLQRWAIFIMGSMGKFLICCQIQPKFRFWLYKKPRHTSWKFQLEIRSNKKVIAKKPLTHLYEMNSSLLYVTCWFCLSFQWCSSGRDATNQHGGCQLWNQQSAGIQTNNERRRHHKQYTTRLAII